MAVNVDYVDCFDLGSGYLSLHAVCRRRSIGREELHALALKKTGKSGVQYLTKAEASGLIDELGTGNGAASGH